MNARKPPGDVIAVATIGLTLAALPMALVSLTATFAMFWSGVSLIIVAACLNADDYRREKRADLERNIDNHTEGAASMLYAKTEDGMVRANAHVLNRALRRSTPAIYRRKDGKQTLLDHGEIIAVARRVSQRAHARH